MILEVSLVLGLGHTIEAMEEIVNLIKFMKDLISGANVMANLMSLKNTRHGT